MFQIVLFEPEIPQNTGNIGRLCLATQSTLHLIEPLGFDLSEKALRRAGLDYWKHLNVNTYPNLEAYLNSISDFSKVGICENPSERSVFDYSFQKGMHLFFGKETTGLPKQFLNQNPQRTFQIPMFDDRVRSLNLANSVGIVLYEAIRQVGL